MLGLTLMMNSFHVSSDKGLGVHCFDTKENMENFLPYNERENRKLCNKV